MVYFPVKARSELVTPRNFSVGGVVDTRRIFQAACAASHRPAARPTRGSGVGVVADTIGFTGAGMTLGGGGGGGGGFPRPPRPAPPPAGSVAGGVAGASAGAGAAGAGVA